MSQLKFLFGGAIQAQIPANNCDISAIRHVPDNQEVFAHSVTDQSIIFDILEYVDAVNDTEAIRFHFKEITGSNEQTKINDISKIDINLEKYFCGDFKILPENIVFETSCDSVYYLKGENFVSKYKEAFKNLVNLHVVVFRYKKFTADIVVTFNDPIFINPESSSLQPSEAESLLKWTPEDFMKTIQTFKILDFKLFLNE